MKRVPILLIPVLLCWLQFGMAQTSAVVAEKQDPLKDSVEKYYKLEQFDKVIPFAGQWSEKLKMNNEKGSIEYGASLNTLGEALRRAGKLREAEVILLQALEVFKKIEAESNLDRVSFENTLGNIFLNLGNVYLLLGKFTVSENYFLQALDVRKKVLGESHSKVADLLNNLGVLYWTTGNYPKTEIYLLKSLEIRKQVLGESHSLVAASMNNLGALYKYMGSYQKAEIYMLGAFEIRKKVLGESHIDLAQSLNNLGALYMDVGNFVKAETCYLRSLEISKDASGESLSQLAILKNNIGIVYKEMGNYPKAEFYYLQALDIRKKIFGEVHPTVATSLNDLGCLYLDFGNFRRAEPYLLQALEMRKKTLGEIHPDVATSLTNLGAFYESMGNFSMAISYQSQSLEISKKALGESHPNYASLLNNLGMQHLAMGNFSKAEDFMLQFNLKKQDQIKRYFPFLSDFEKEQFYENKLTVYQQKFKSFCVSRYASNKAIAMDLYNDQLATKGLLLNSSAKWKHRIKTSGDKKIFNLFIEWELNQNKLNKLLQSSDSTERAGLDSLQEKTEKMEKELSLRSENFAQLAEKKLINWKDVQKALKPGEAAVEMIRVKKFGIEKTVTDTSDPMKRVYKVKGLTDTISYAALIVKPESVFPEMVLLKNGNELEGKGLKYYQNSISKQLPDIQSYGKFWEKIGIKLGNSNRVYFSPDGVFHNINLNTLYNPKTKKCLLEEKDIRLVTVTKDIVNPGAAEEDNKLAELVGFPSYYTNSPTASTSISQRKSPEMSYGLRLESIGTLAELPGTKTEVDKIAGILASKGWEVKNYTGSNALETNIKESYKPRLLHVATHGFFQPDTSKGSNPLLRSGLMLTGAGSTLKGEKNESGEDGILTAYEAMNLNLDNTDLVVLSACETGLGEIKNGEGVYGLQRAFKVAGAKSIIMSLWKVDDEATQELMVSFYKNWLSNRTDSLELSVRSKRQAFLQAQKELKAKYPDPYYWGAFVMMGE